jgi:hypothetical protein
MDDFLAGDREASDLNQARNSLFALAAASATAMTARLMDQIKIDIEQYATASSPRLN